MAFAAAVPEASAADSFCQRSVDRDPRDDWSYAFSKLSGHFEWVNLEPLKNCSLNLKTRLFSFFLFAISTCVCVCVCVCVIG